MKNLILVTQSYPFANSETFLHNEMSYLAEAFKKIIIIPIHSCEGEVRILPNNCVVNKSFLDTKKNYSKVKFFLLGFKQFFVNPIFYTRYISRNLSRFDLKFFNRYLKWLGVLLFAQKWFYGFFSKEKLSEKETLFYSYWFTYFSIVGKSNLISDLTSVSRAHGFDLYDERQEPPEIFWKEFILSKIDKVFLISRHGKEYLTNLFPKYSSKLVLSRLGTKDPGTLNKIDPQSDTFHILSCSYVKKVKRVDLIADALQVLIRRTSSLKIHWTHIGGGELFEDLKKNVLQLPENIKVDLTGSVLNDFIFEFYKNNPVDVFINVSSSEGLPVSIMEAQSFGIPVIATDVGGTSEIVNESNGVLLDANPSNTKISEYLLKIILNKTEWSKKRFISRKNWEKHFNADLNYNNFVKEISKKNYESLNCN